MNTLSPGTANLLKEYQRAEREDMQNAALELLDRFIDAILSEAPDIKKRWALDCAASVADYNMAFPVRLPLFQRVLLPVLVDGVLQDEPGCARWLAHFESLLYQLSKSNELALPEHLYNKVWLLKAALRLDPADLLARRHLVEQHADYLAYTLHELPAGVLYSPDYATVAECTDLLEFLEEFKAHISALGNFDQYADLIARCEFHYHTYREYLSAQPDDSDETYKHYYRQRGAPDEQTKPAVTVRSVQQEKFSRAQARTTLQDAFSRGEIIPGERIGIFHLGMSWQELQALLPPIYEREQRQSGFVINTPSLSFFVDDGSEKVLQVIAIGSFGGKFAGRIHIGSTARQIETVLGHRKPKGRTLWEAPDYPGISFCWEPNQDRAGVTYIAVYSKDL